MLLRWLCAIVVLPGTVVVLVPLAILSLESGGVGSIGVASPREWQFWLGTALAAVGLGFGLWTMSLFFQFGEGTPAPWDPPQKLVIRGPYRHVRNPMIVGVILMVLGESQVFGSWWVGLWAALFFVGNSIYFPLVEEPGLLKRFGKDYNIYLANVGRWVPRLTPWQPLASSSEEGDAEGETSA